MLRLWNFQYERLSDYGSYKTSRICIMEFSKKAVIHNESVQRLDNWRTKYILV
jgi:hypothetical protein